MWPLTIIKDAQYPGIRIKQIKMITRLFQTHQTDKNESDNILSVEVVMKTEVLTHCRWEI